MPLLPAGARIQTSLALHVGVSISFRVCGLPTRLLVFVLEVMHPATLICGISAELTGGILLAVKRICLGFAVLGKESPPNTLTTESSQELFMKKRAPDSGPCGHCLRTAPSFYHYKALFRFPVTPALSLTATQVPGSALRITPNSCPASGHSRLGNPGVIPSSPAPPPPLSDSVSPYVYFVASPKTSCTSEILLL